MVHNLINWLSIFKGGSRSERKAARVSQLWEADDSTKLTSPGRPAWCPVHGDGRGQEVQQRNLHGRSGLSRWATECKHDWWHYARLSRLPTKRCCWGLRRPVHIDEEFWDISTSPCPRTSLVLRRCSTGPARTHEEVLRRRPRWSPCTQTMPPTYYGQTNLVIKI